MIDIKSEALCTYCEKLNDTKREGCEGDWCDSSYASYMEAHGLESGVSTFGNLRVGDAVYMISANRLLLSKCDVVGIRVSDDASNLCLSLRGMGSPVVSKNSRKTTDNTLFINKQDAIDEYKKGMFAVIEKMMDIVRNT